jgi:hypothetical protein
MKHIHHIVPKHAGGTDDPSNLIELSVEDHAEAHRLLYEKYGKQADFYAWQGLSGIIGKEEQVKAASSRGGKTASANNWKSGKWTVELCGQAGKAAMKKRAVNGTLSEYQRNAGKAGIGECKAQGARVSNKSRASAYINPYGIIFEGANEAAEFYAVHPCHIRGNPSRFNLTIIRK